MTDLDLDALEATARAATPGPRYPTTTAAAMSMNEGERGMVFDSYEPSDRAFFATFDPPTVLALIARLRTAENVVKDYDANFPCDGGCNVNDGPEETCSRHGRSPSDLWNIAEEQIKRANDAEARLREAEACIEAAMDYAPDPTETGFETEAAMCRILSRYETTKTENGSER